MKSRSYKGQRETCWLIVLVTGALILSACSAPPAPAEPLPSILIEPPGPSIDVAPGARMPISAQPQGIEPQVTWTSTCYPDVACNVLENTTGTDNFFFTAPDTPVEQVIVRATVKDKYGREASTALAFKVQIPTPTLTSTLTPTSTPTPTPTPEPPTLLITSPRTGDVVTMTISVTVTMAKPSMLGGTSLYVLVRPHQLNDQDSLFDYWGQPQPNINSDGTWSAWPVGVGTEIDPRRSFDICAVLTSRTITSTNYSALPPGPASCNTVTRK
jgi:hypothetical protein